MIMQTMQLTLLKAHSGSATGWIGGKKKRVHSLCMWSEAPVNAFAN